HRSLTEPRRLAMGLLHQPTRLSHQLSALMENRSGLLVDLSIAEATGTAEREQALVLLARSRRRHRLPRRRTVGGDGGYHGGEFLAAAERARGTAHVPVPRGPIDPKAKGAA